MHIGTQNFAIQNHAAQRPIQVHNHEQSGSSSRGERLVARHDQDNDAKLSISELQDTRLGKKISVDQFSRMDRNGDGQLEAGELNRRGHHHGHHHDHHKTRHHDGPSQVESVLVARFADQLAAPATPPEPANLGEDIAKALLARLDKDDSGGLNSEEIAGSKLAEKIGAGFYELDGDKNGTLDTGELSAFITSQFLGAAPSDEAGEVADTDQDSSVTPLAPPAADPVITQDAELVAEIAPEVAVDPVQDAPSVSLPPQSSYADSLRASFEAALEVLQKGNEQQQAALNVVRTLYAEANKAFG